MATATKNKRLGANEIQRRIEEAAKKPSPCPKCGRQGKPCATPGMLHCADCDFNWQPWAVETRRQELQLANPQNGHPSLNSTTTPAGVAANDPDVDMIDCPHCGLKTWNKRLSDGSLICGNCTKQITPEQADGAQEIADDVANARAQPAAKKKSRAKLASEGIGRGVACPKCGATLTVPLGGGEHACAMCNRNFQEEKPPTALPEGPVIAGGVHREISLKDLVPSDTNPRAHFDEKELQDLAASIKEQGVLEPLIVRTRRGGALNFEIVAGERRYKAAKLAGRSTVPCIVRQMTDEQVELAQLHENMKRADLNPIDEAVAFKRMTAADAGGKPRMTQQQLADVLQISQGQVANRIRLLDLPKEWQARVMSREIPASHAKELLPYKDHPTVLKAVAQAIKRDGVPSLKEFEEAVDYCVRQNSKEMQGSEWSSRTYTHVPIFKPTAAQRVQLKIVEVTDYRGKVEERATNVQLWTQLQAAHEKEYAKKHGDRDDDRQGKTPPAERTPAQQKAREKELAKQFAKRLEAFRHDWMRYLCAQVLATRSTAACRTGNKLVLMLLVDEQGRCGQHFGWNVRGDILEEVLGEKAKTTRKGSYYPTSDWMGTLAKVKDPADLIQKWIVNCFWNEEEKQPVGGFDDDYVAALVEELSIDLAACWAKERCGPLTEAYFNLHTSGQLDALAKEINRQGHALPKNATKSVKVKWLMDCPTTLKFPAEMAGKKARGK